MVWIPVDEDEIRVALDAGNVRENQGLDFKRESGSTDGGRRETAADMASFAVHGGQLVIGVAEDKATARFSLAPQPLAGAAEKLEDIARNRVDPPLFIRVHDIPSSADPSVGYLVVEIPPSPTAPHMVDGRYFGRGDRVKRRLPDAEVVQLHARRRSADDELRGRLEEWASRDVVSSSVRQNGHLHLIAEPLLQTNVAAFQAVARSHDGTVARDLVATVERSLSAPLRRFEPRIGSGAQWRRRPDGGALTTLGPGIPTLGETGREDSLVEVELHDNGGLAVLLGRLTAFLQESGRDLHVIFDVAVVNYALSVVSLAREVANMTNYRGPWGFGVHADRLAGNRSFTLHDDPTVISSIVDSYGAMSFTQVTTAHLQEMEDDPGAVVDRLVGRLLHGLGSHRYFWPES